MLLTDSNAHCTLKATYRLCMISAFVTLPLCLGVEKNTLPLCKRHEMLRFIDGMIRYIGYARHGHLERFLTAFLFVVLNVRVSNVGMRLYGRIGKQV